MLFRFIRKVSVLAIFFLLLAALYGFLFPLTVMVKHEMQINNYKPSDEEYLILVNKTHTLSENYVPSDLVDAAVKGLLLREEASRALEKLLLDASIDKIDLYCLSGYRSYWSQKQLFEKKYREFGRAMTDKYVAFPGQSEHQTGLALDIADRDSVNQLLKPSFGKTKEGIWLRNNSWKFGFILRYPSDKEKITGYSYEPWHIRYVGLTAAQEIATKKICLEEYLFNIRN